MNTFSCLLWVGGGGKAVDYDAVNGSLPSSCLVARAQPSGGGRAAVRVLTQQRWHGAAVRAPQPARPDRRRQAAARRTAATGYLHVGWIIGHKIVVGHTDWATYLSVTPYRSLTTPA